MKTLPSALAAVAALLCAQSANAALVTLAFDGTIGPFTTPATLSGGDFDGTIRFDDNRPFPNLPATLSVTDGPLARTYTFGAAANAFVPSAYRVTYDATAFRFQGTSDDGASLNFNLTGRGGGAYSGSFAFARGSDFSAVGTATIGAQPEAAAVPEPATWAMMVGGVAMVGGAMRRRRSLASGNGEGSGVSGRTWATGRSWA